MKNHDSRSVIQDGAPEYLAGMGHAAAQDTGKAPVDGIDLVPGVLDEEEEHFLRLVPDFRCAENPGLVGGVDVAPVGYRALPYDLTNRV